ncbi:MAG: nucleotidyl transferase AbiEii/AbiGii toxin family protein [Candidatus Omnitrophota bacterium]
MAQKEMLKILAGRINDFYLAGGTALSIFYLTHRQSDDLDFFTKKFGTTRVERIIDYLRETTKKKITLIGQNLSRQTAKMMVYNIEFVKDNFLRIDFVEDVLPLIKATELFDGINVLSIEDIYLRKIYTVSGLSMEIDEVGRRQFSGGRQEAKDLFDIYFLSQKYLRLSDFVDKYCEQILKEGVIRWFRTFKRLEMKADLAEIKTEKNIEFSDIDKHLSSEIDRILLREVDF